MPVRFASLIAVTNHIIFNHADCILDVDSDALIPLLHLPQRVVRAALMRLHALSA